ncbi:conserved Plasmodium protein, unknown function [Plasmodium ovale wallikeri]|uniref:Uncharacterized protein n=1 Tax=Plasmodium ovale wallikeri TaxID=864142 RepID=A0A1A8YVH5_PLAOA|nr:conserved Plasmodium protein, unknown function [Plasmodium ovale wallikeri]
MQARLCAYVLHDLPGVHRYALSSINQTQLQKGIVESRNIKVNVDGNVYTLLYEPKRVKFSDLDILKIMFHANHVKHCGDSVICYILKITSKDVFKMNYLVRHIDITFDKPLKYENAYKIIGAVTNYGSTSLTVTLFGVGAESIVPDNETDVHLLRDNSKVDKNKRKEKNIERFLDQYEENDDTVISVNDKNLQEIAQKKKCINYFTVKYTLVQVDESGTKSTIDEQFKNEHKPMEIEKLKELINIFC